MTYQFIILTRVQFDSVRGYLGWKIGEEPRVGPDGRVLINRAGNVPFSLSELEIFKGMEGVLIIPSDEIQLWLDEHGWDAPVEGKL